MSERLVDLQTHLLMLQVYLYISSSKHVLGCLVSEQITSASPVVPASDNRLASSATSTGPLGSNPPSTPMSAPPFVKHRHLTSQLNLTASSMLPQCHSALSSSEHSIVSCSEVHLHRTSHAPSGSCAQLCNSVSSSQSTLVSSSVMLSSQPDRRQPKPNLLTRWLATSQQKAASTQSLPFKAQPNSPISAGSAAASRQGEEGCHAAVDSRPAWSGVSENLPMAPLADVTNVLAPDIASGGSSLVHKGLSAEAQHAERDLHKNATTNDPGSAVATQHFVQQQQQQPDLVSQSMNGQVCPHLHAEEDSPDHQKCDGLLEDCKGSNRAQVQTDMAAVTMPQ